jgi:hypothetical protein
VDRKLESPPVRRIWLMRLPKFRIRLTVRRLMIVPLSTSVEFLGDRKAIAALVGYHGRLKEKYERAARAPWSPVEPDPAEPK